MQEEILVRVESVSKKFCRDLKRSLYYGMQDIASELFGISRKGSLRKKEFWAVNNISFELRRGECLGLIGHNGAGKSTLLKMLNGLIKPDKGDITIKGRIGALIELGAGFNPILTGRENIYNNGAVLGFTKKEIDEKFNDIIEFSEIGEFIDTPVQNYSSGMKVRLGFAVAAQMQPDVLLIDEVLAVGDMGFILKCFNKIDELLQNTAVIFVSHNMPHVFRISSHLLLQEKGSPIYFGKDVSKGIDLYYSGFNTVKSHAIHDEAEILKMSLNNHPCKEGEIVKVNRLSDLVIDLQLRIDSKYKNPDVVLVFYDKELRGVAEFFEEEGNGITNQNGEIFLKINLPKISFSKGIYSISVAVSGQRRGKILLREQSVAYFQVISKLNVWTSFQLDGSLHQLNT